MFYCIDHIGVVNTLSRKARDGVTVQLILDRTQMLKPSCAQQLNRVVDMLEWGVEIRTWRPERGNFAALHIKSAVVDRKQLLVGSANPTHNGYESSCENVARIAGEDPAAQFCQLFEEVWPQATPVDKRATVIAANEQERSRQQRRSQSRPRELMA